MHVNLLCSRHAYGQSYQQDCRVCNRDEVRSKRHMSYDITERSVHNTIVTIHTEI